MKVTRWFRNLKKKYWVEALQERKIESTNTTQTEAVDMYVTAV